LNIIRNEIYVFIITLFIGFSCKCPSRGSGDLATESANVWSTEALQRGEDKGRSHAATRRHECAGWQGRYII